MGDYDGWTSVCRLELLVDPVRMQVEQCSRIFRSEYSIGCCADPNPAEVANPLPRLQFRARVCLIIVKELEVGPQRCAQKADVTDDNLASIQHVNVRGGAEPEHFFGTAVDAAAIELVVPKHVHHG